MKQKAFFLDRDGVVNRMHYDQEHGIIDSPLNPKQFFLMPGIENLIKTAKKLGYKVIIVSNQPVVAKGKTSLKKLEQITKKMIRQLRTKKAEIDDIFYCLHHPQAANPEYRKNCLCRKPKPGMLLQAADKFNIDLKKSIVVGDGLVDIQAGIAAGCQTVLVANDKIEVRNFLAKFKLGPDLIAENFEDVIRYLKSRKNGKA